MAQSGIIGGDFPNHRTPFKFVDGPTELKPGQDQLDVRFVAETGGVRVTKTFAFKRGHYDAEVTHEIVNLTDKPVTPSIYLQLMRDGNKPDGESALYYVYTGGAVFTEQDKFRKVEFSDIEKRQGDAAEACEQRLDRHDPALLRQCLGAAARVHARLLRREVTSNLYFIGTKFALPVACTQRVDQFAIDAVRRTAGSTCARENRARDSIWWSITAG